MINNYLIKIIEDLEEVRELDILESAHNENEFEEAYLEGLKMGLEFGFRTLHKLYEL